MVRFTLSFPLFRYAQCSQGMSCLFAFSDGSSSYWAPPRPPMICWECVGTSTLIALSFRSSRCMRISSTFPSSAEKSFRMDVQWSILLARYGKNWRFRRKIVERGFRPGSLSAYRVIRETRARVLATRLLQSPQEWISHIELSVYFSPFCSYCVPQSYILLFFF